MACEPTVFIVHADCEVREALQSLAVASGLQVECYTRAEDYLRVYDPQRPGCLIVDVHLAGMSGLQLLERLSRCGSRLPVVFVTAHGDVSSATQALKAGALDFLETPICPDALLELIQAAMRHDAQNRRLAAETEAITARLARLSRRERQVLDRVLVGGTTKSIALELGLSPKTVDFHRVRLMAKMQTDSIAELVRMVLTVRGLPGAADSPRTNGKARGTRRKQPCPPHEPS